MRNSGITQTFAIAAFLLATINWYQLAAAGYIDPPLIRPEYWFIAILGAATFALAAPQLRTVLERRGLYDRL